VKLRVNSDRENAHVWLFLHIAGNAGREAKRIQLDGKSLEVDVPLTLKDMPNMFLEGVTVHGAEVHTAVRQILLPPVSKMIEVTLEPAKPKVKPRRNPASSSPSRTPMANRSPAPPPSRSTTNPSKPSPAAPTSARSTRTSGTGKTLLPRQPSGNSLPFPVGNLLRPKTIGMQPSAAFGDDMVLMAGGDSVSGPPWWNGEKMAHGARMEMDVSEWNGHGGRRWLPMAHGDG
jgi:alpha-2-macroglobulin